MQNGFAHDVGIIKIDLSREIVVFVMTDRDNDNDFAKIRELLETLRKETDFCMERLQYLEQNKESHATESHATEPHNIEKGQTHKSEHPKKTALDTISDPVKRDNIIQLLLAIDYIPGDSLRDTIAKLETYIFKHNFINYKNYNIKPDIYIAKAFGLKESQEISYERLLGLIPSMFE